jgi:hypothetical protein
MTKYNLGVLMTLALIWLLGIEVNARLVMTMTTLIIFIEATSIIVQDIVRKLEEAANA